jgi:hypothetical protein
MPIDLIKAMDAAPLLGITYVNLRNLTRYQNAFTKEVTLFVIKGKHFYRRADIDTFSHRHDIKAISRAAIRLDYAKKPAKSPVLPAKLTGFNPALVRFFLTLPSVH